jgi:large subunit ribosomal protein L19
MSSEIMRKVAEGQLKKRSGLNFRVGDTVEVRTRITEGDKERLQPFTGVVTRRSGAGLDENFVVRRIVQGEGVERTFPLQSPTIASVTVKRAGKVRRARLYYLRSRRGKAARIRARNVPGQGKKG